MASFRTSITGTSATTIDVVVEIWADPRSRGIETINLTNGRSSIATRSLECARTFRDVFTIDRSDLPVFLEIEECPVDDGAPPDVTTSPPLYAELSTGPTGPGPVLCLPNDVFDPTPPSPECVERLNALRGLIGEIESACDAARIAQNDRDAARTVATAAGAAAVALGVAAAEAAGAGPYGWILTLILGIAAAIAAAIAVAKMVEAEGAQTRLNVALRTASAARARYREAFNQLRGVCCPRHIDVPADPPACEI